MLGYMSCGSRRPLRAVLALAAIAASATGVAACGSSSNHTSSAAAAANPPTPAATSGASSTPSTSSTASASSTGVSSVTALATQLLQRPTSIGVTQPVGKPIPTGKNIDWISCGVPACVTLGNTFAAGAKELGWTVHVINTDGTPEQVKAAWTQTTISKPDAVASSGTDLSVVGPEIAKLKSENIPVALYAVTPTAPGVSVLIGDLKGEAESYGEPMAAWIVKDSGGKANTLLVSLPSYPILAGLTSGFKSVYAQGCPGCKLTNLALPLSALGKDVPQLIISALRADPSINYVVMSVDDLTAGLPAALRAAGLSSQVKIVGSSSGPTNYEYINAGQEAAGVPNAFYEDTWLMVDGLARVFTGQSAQVDESVVPPRMIVTKANLPSTSAVFPLDVNYKQQFLALWGKS